MGLPDQVRRAGPGPLSTSTSGVRSRTTPPGGSPYARTGTGPARRAAEDARTPSASGASRPATLPHTVELLDEKARLFCETSVEAPEIRLALFTGLKSAPGDRVRGQPSRPSSKLAK
ncbi:hypothetical protein [Streptomyces sp. NPDC050535]|uniref:hypothetical protein n=1 Tax=Streptomyces sp. NPDC050535 TaxID=3365626 RepID=UPI00379BC6BE